MQCPLCCDAIDASALRPGATVECDRCGAGLSFKREGTVWSVADVEEPPSPASWAVRPTRCGGVRAERPWRSSAALVFAVSMATLAALLFGVIALSNGGIWGGPGGPGALLGALVAGYAFAAVLVNRTVLELGAKTLTYSHGPLPIPGLANACVDRAEVSSVLTSIQRTMRTNHGRAVQPLKTFTSGWNIDLELLDGTRKTLVPNVKTLAERRWILHVLHRSPGPAGEPASRAR